MAARADQEEHNEPLTDPISVEAFLNADLVEGFTADSRILPASYYGFQNIVFNRIHGRAPGNGAAGIDNIEFTHAASVPEPATLALVALGAICRLTHTLAESARRRSESHTSTNVRPFEIKPAALRQLEFNVSWNGPPERLADSFRMTKVKGDPIADRTL